MSQLAVRGEFLTQKYLAQSLQQNLVSFSLFLLSTLLGVPAALSLAYSESSFRLLYTQLNFAQQVLKEL